MQNGTQGLQARNRDTYVKMAKKLAIRRENMKADGASAEQIRHSLTATADGLSPYGGNGFLTPRGENDFMSLSFAGAFELGEILGAMPTNTQKKEFYYLEYIADAVHQSTSGATDQQVGVADYCGPRPSYTELKYPAECSGFKLIGSSGGTEVAGNNTVDYEATRTLMRLDGTAITTNEERRAYIAMQGNMLQLREWAYTGGNTGAAQPGLSTIVNTGKTDANGVARQALDSTVIDWANASTYSDATPATYDGSHGNGNIAANTHIMTVIEEVIHINKMKIKNSVGLSGQALRTGDIFIVGNSVKIREIMKAAVCRHVCGTGALTMAELTNALGSLEAQNYRNELYANGIYGYGHIQVDGMDIPLLADDFAGDSVYILTRGVGNIPLLYFEYKNFNQTTDLDRRPTNLIDITDGGKFYHYWNEDARCIEYNVDMEVRLCCEAPFLQARIDNFAATGTLGNYSNNPYSPSFLSGAI